MDKKSIYFGESARCGYLRGFEHLDGYIKNYYNNILYVHHKMHHKNMKKSTNNFKMVLTGNYKTPTERQTSEGVQISNLIKERDRKLKISSDRTNPEIIILNSKNQFHQPGIIRTKTMKNNYE